MGPPGPCEPAGPAYDARPMSAPLAEIGRSGGGPQRRGLTVGLVMVLALGLVVGVIWLLGRGQGAGSGDQAAVVGAAPPVTPAESRFDAPVPAPRDGASEAAQPETALPEASPPQATPLQTGPDVVPEEWRDIRGAVVRASDESAVGSATVIAVQRDREANGYTERARVSADTDGNFVLHVPRLIETFRVLVPAPGRPRDDPRPGPEVPVSVQWENGDPNSTAVRLVLETGWRLDLRVLDSAGKPREGVLVEGGGRTATSDVMGLCTLLDLPVGTKPLTLKLRTAPDAKAVTHTLDAPAAGQLRQQAELSVP